jgi:hypothetical protein
MSASGRSWPRPTPWRPADRPAAARHQLAGRRRHRVRPDPVRHRLGRSPRSLPPGQDQPQLAARPQPRRPAGHPGHLPAAGLPPLPRPVTMHPLPGQRPARDLPASPSAGGPAADQGRAGHRRLAPTLRTPMRRREPDLPSLPAQRPPGPLPRPGQDPPAARADRAGHQPDPRRRLAHRDRNDRKPDLPTRPADPTPTSNPNSPAESDSWRLWADSSRDWPGAFGSNCRPGPPI